ncbi:MAG TPA: nuclear transport factor 2 family protein [Nevskiaceae bacterium]|nr:nuclear transport factor 2 family protein [Nevskiaceae bacterium]
MTREHRTRELALAFFDAMNRGDTAAIVEAYAEDGYCHTMGRTLISGKFSKAQIAQAAGQIFEVFPDGIRFTIHAMTVEGDRVAVEASSEGRHVSGKVYTNEYHFLMQFRGDRLAVFREYMDTERVTDILCGGQRP